MRKLSFFGLLLIITAFMFNSAMALDPVEPCKQAESEPDWTRWPAPKVVTYSSGQTEIKYEYFPFEIQCPGSNEVCIIYVEMWYRTRIETVGTEQHTFYEVQLTDYYTEPKEKDENDPDKECPCWDDIGFIYWTAVEVFMNKVDEYEENGIDIKFLKTDGAYYAAYIGACWSDMTEVIDTGNMSSGPPYTGPIKGVFTGGPIPVPSYKKNNDKIQSTTSVKRCVKCIEVPCCRVDFAISWNVDEDTDEKYVDALHLASDVINPSSDNCEGKLLGIYQCYPVCDVLNIAGNINQINSTDESNAIETLINIYPNPGDGNFTLELSCVENGAFKFEVFDIEGNIIFFTCN